MRTSSDNICSNGEKVKGTQLKNVTQNNVTIYIHDQYCRRSLKGETLGPGEDLYDKGTVNCRQEGFSGLLPHLIL